MTDNEIIKAFDCCNNKTLDCDECPCHYKQEKPCLELDNLVFDLINRQKAEIFKEKNKNSKLRNERNRLKAEVERLTAERDAMHQDVIAAEEYAWQCKTAKAEAYKEFAERLKENSIATFSWNGVVLVEEIDNLLKEMESDNDE